MKVQELIDRLQLVADKEGEIIVVPKKSQIGYDDIVQVITRERGVVLVTMMGDMERW
jgi:hypothetical protein